MPYRLRCLSGCTGTDTAGAWVYVREDAPFADPDPRRRFFADRGIVRAIAPSAQ